MSYADDILDSIDEAIFKLDGELRILYLNQAAKKFWRIEEGAGHSFAEFAGKEELEIVSRSLVQQGKEVARVFSPRMGKWVNISSQLSDEGEFLVILHPLGDAYKEAQLLPDQSWCFRKAEELGQVGSFEWLLQEDRIYWTDELYVIHGLAPQSEELSFDKILDFTHADDRERVINAIKEFYEFGKPLDVTYHIVRADGSVRQLRRTAEMVFDETGKLIKVYGSIQDITDQEVTRTEIDSTRRLLQGVFDTSTFAITVFESIRNDEGEIIDLRYLLENKVAAEFWKNGRIGNGLLQLYPSAKRVGLFDLLKEVLESGIPVDRELHISGEILKGWYRITANKLGDGLVTILEDISARKVQEEELRKSFYILSNREAISKSGSWEYDRASGTLTWSAGMYDIYGVDNTEAPTLQQYQTLAFPYEINKCLRLIEHIQGSGSPVEEQMDMRIHEHKKVVRISVVPMFDQEGKVSKMIGIDFDITEKLSAENELRQQDNFIRQIAEASPDLITLFDVRTRLFFYANKPFFQFTGLTIPNRPGLNILELRHRVHPLDWSRFNSFFESFSSASISEIREMELRIKNPEGKWRWLRVRGKSFEIDEKGSIAQVMAIFQDITERKEIRRQLDRQNHFIEEVTKATPDTICIFDLEKELVLYNNKRVYSGDAGDNGPVTLATVKEMVHPEDLPQLDDFLEEFKRNPEPGIRVLEYRSKYLTKNWTWFKARAVEFKRNRAGQTTQIICIIQDCSREKEAEERLRENEFMQALLVKKDEFISVASHELKTPITTIKASLQILQRQVEKHMEEAVLMVFIRKANLQINKLINLIGDLLDNTKIQSGKMLLNISSCQIGDLIAETLIHGFEEDRIRVINEVEEPVELDRIRIEQVLTNFLSNAIKYSPGTKEILLRVTREADFVKVSVRDFGIGIPPEKLAHVFDRYYRVEESSSQFAGLGLGLYISAEIIKLHQGDYGVESEPGQGSTFWFRIPFRQFSTV